MPAATGACALHRAGRADVLSTCVLVLRTLLAHCRSVSDWNNALKLGYDPETEAYPDWLTQQVQGWQVKLAVHSSTPFDSPQHVALHHALHCIA